MTEQEIERCLERFTMGKACDVMNFDYAGTFAYIQRLKAENAELKSSLTHVNEELKTRIRRAEKAVYIAARDEIEATYNVETMDKREYAEQIEVYMFDLFCRADRELAEEGKDEQS